MSQIFVVQDIRATYLTFVLDFTRIGVPFDDQHTMWCQGLDSA